MRKHDGFTLLEMLLVIAIMSIVAAIALPGLIRARQASNESSAIGSIRAVNSGQTAYASTCAAGGYAQNNVDLAKGPAGGAPFVGPDLEQADVVGHSKSGYLVDVSDSKNASNRDVMPAASTCNASVANARMLYFVAADPVTRGQSGGRSFAAERNGTIYYDVNGPIANPIPAGLSAFIQ